MKSCALFILFCMFFSDSMAQDCKVLEDSLKGTYEGECKKGLANGNGTAAGTDRYTGHFKNGYPDGNGKYTWKNGDWYEGEWKKGKQNGMGTFSHRVINGQGQTETLTGFFKNGEYKGKFEKPYSTEMLTNNFTSISVKKMNTLVSEITFTVKNTTAGGSTNSQPVLPKSEIKNIQLLQGNYTEMIYDTTSQVTNRYIFRNIIYPFSAIITFERARSVQQVAIAKIELNENGNWMIRVDVEQ
ncbi:MAG TPA: hypothetical protein PLB49_11320 [Chitinophagaceae bacterium]|nr:hypothetical protein [Chitinophagaceae bacterium]